MNIIRIQHWQSIESATICRKRFSSSEGRGLKTYSKARIKDSAIIIIALIVVVVVAYIFIFSSTVMGASTKIKNECSDKMPIIDCR